MVLAYILTGVVLALWWAAVVVLALPWWVGAIPTLLAGSAFGAIFGVKAAKARKAAAELEKSIQQQNAAQLQQVRPDQQGEIQAMQAEFAKAVASLKNSKVARGRRDALYVLPWYVIIGPPGAGKSTALRKSGLQFPYLSKRGGGVKGVGGTRNCEWWLTNDAVILDTAGRYTTEEDDRDEWFAFLDALARYRPKRPVNGLIVAVSTQDLLGADGPDGIAQLAERIRERLNEVTERLRTVLPVYVLVTKCDLMAGFVETFGYLSRRDRGQIWGFTLPPSDAPATEVLEQNFDEIAQSLDELCLKRIGEERHPDARDRIFAFPLQFDALRSPLAELIDALFSQNVYADAPLMRGVYFTSGTQEGRLIDRVIATMADAFGVRKSLPPQSADQGVEAKSYFLHDLFAEVMFKDQDLAVRSSKEVSRHKRLEYGYAAGGAALALLLLWLPTLSFFNNRAALKELRAAVEAPAVQNAKGVEVIAALAPVSERLSAIVRAEEEGTPWSSGFGMYQGDTVLPILRAWYGRAIRTEIVEPLIDLDADLLTAFVRENAGSGALDRGEHARFYDRLHLHLLATAPRGDGEPGLSAPEIEWFVKHVTSRWARTPTIAANAQLGAQLKAHVELYAKLLGSDPALALPRNPQLVKEVRRTLARIPPEALALDRLVSDPALERFAVGVGDILGGATSRIRGDGRVRGAFTRNGYEQVLKAKIASPDAQDAWVMGDGGGARAPESSAERLRSKYFEAYIEEWRDFLASLQYERGASLPESLVMLEDLTRGVPPPLRRVFLALATHTDLVDESVADEALVDGLRKKANKILGKNAKAVAQVQGVVAAGMGGSAEEVLLTERDLKAEFMPLVRFGVPPKTPDAPDAPPPAPTPLDHFQEQLVAVRDATRLAVESAENVAAMQARVATTRLAVASLINAQPIGWRPRLEALLMPPLEGAGESAAAGRVQRVNEDWCSTVVSAFEGSLADRYPFAKQGHDAALADVAQFFRPGAGVVWAFYQSALANDVKRFGSSYRLAQTSGVTRYDGQLLRFLDQADEVTQALFAPGGAEPLVSFAVQVQPVVNAAAVVFTVDGESIEYRNGPEEWRELRWPRPDGKKLGASLQVRNSSGVAETLNLEGEWGLFRLLEAGTVRAQPGARVFSVTWPIATLHTEVTINFRPHRTETPFFGRARGKPVLLAPFRSDSVRPPRNLGRGGGGCPL